MYSQTHLSLAGRVCERKMLRLHELSHTFGLLSLPVSFSFSVAPLLLQIFEETLQKKLEDVGNYSMLFWNSHNKLLELESSEGHVHFLHKTPIRAVNNGHCFYRQCTQVTNPSNVMSVTKHSALSWSCSPTWGDTRE